MSFYILDVEYYMSNMQYYNIPVLSIYVYLHSIYKYAIHNVYIRIVPIAWYLLPIHLFQPLLARVSLQLPATNTFQSHDLDLATAAIPCNPAPCRLKSTDTAKCRFRYCAIFKRQGSSGKDRHIIAQAVSKAALHLPPWPRHEVSWTQLAIRNRG